MFTTKTTKIVLNCAVAGILLSTPLLANAAEGKATTERKSELSTVERLDAVYQIQQAMSKHAFYYSAGEHEKELNEVWAMKTPGVCFGTDDGYWCGADLIRAAYLKYFDHMRQRDLDDLSKKYPQIKNVKENWGAASFMFHSLTTPVIEVAGDGKSAKAMWYSPGFVSQTPGGVPDAKWMWERYACDFVKENGKWKMWHFFVHTDIAADPGQSFAHNPDTQRPSEQLGADGKPVLPPGQDGTMPSINYKGEYNAPTWAPPSEYPKVPVPYYTFSETFSYGPSDPTANTK